MDSATTAEAPVTAFIVEDADLGQRLDRLIAEKIPDLSRSRVKALIEASQVLVNDDTITNPSLRVKPGSRIRIDIPPPVDDAPVAQKMDLSIIYEDSSLVVLDKPAGLVVHPAPGNWDSTLVNALLAHCGDSLEGIGGVKRPGIVHRLDKDTSGLMIVAKTAVAHASLSAAFADRTVERAYWAVVWGVPAPRNGVIDAPIGRSPANRKKMAVVSNGKHAITHYKVIRPLGRFASLMECRLKTGRTHQIRVHMTHLGHSLIADPVYGKTPAKIRQLGDEGLHEAVTKFSRQALHAWLLGFDHPVSGEHLRFESQIPSDLAGLISSLERS